MGKDFEYRIGSVDDFNQLLALGYDSYSEFANVLSHEGWKTLETGLRNKEKLFDLIQKSTVFVCENDGQIIGAAYLVPSGNPTPIFDKDWCYIRMLGVAPHFRGFGIAKKLTAKCIEHALANKEKTMALHTSEFMDAARHIYENLGFRKIMEIDPIFGKRYWLYKLDLNKEQLTPSETLKK